MTAPVRYLTRCALVLLALAMSGQTSAEGEIAVIVSSDARPVSITPAVLADIYLRKIFLDDDGRPYIPVNLPPDSPLRRSLARALFGKSTQELQDYWNQRYFQGITPPYVLGSQEAVIQFVAGTKGAIGYIAACLIDARIRQLMTISAPAAERPALEKLCDTSRHNHRPD